MKTLFATTALALSVAGAASAMVDSSALNQYAPNADVSAISAADANTILSVIHSGDSESEKRAVIQALLK